MRMDAIPADSYLTPSPGPLHLSSIQWQKFPLKVIVVFSEHPTMAKDLRSVPAVIPLHQSLFYLSIHAEIVSKQSSSLKRPLALFLCSTSPD